MSVKMAALEEKANAGESPESAHGSAEEGVPERRKRCRQRCAQGGEDRGGKNPARDLFFHGEQQARVGRQHEHVRIAVAGITRKGLPERHGIRVEAAKGRSQDVAESDLLHAACGHGGVDERRSREAFQRGTLCKRHGLPPG